MQKLFFFVNQNLLKINFFRNLVSTFVFTITFHLCIIFVFHVQNSNKINTDIKFKSEWIKMMNMVMQKKNFQIYLE